MGVDVDSLLANSGINAEENTWKRRSNVIPNIIKGDTFITVRTDTHDVQITRFEEAILEIVLSFTFAPVWLVEQWLEERAIVSSQTVTDTIISWIESGLVWLQGSVTGEYLRPTHLLFKLFGRTPERFVDIPFNQLTHTISEQSVAFDVMTGSEKSPINRAFKHMYLPKYSPLGIPQSELDRGTNIIREAEFKSIAVYSAKSVPEIEHVEAEIKEMIDRGESLTPEFEDFKKFIIIKKQDNTGIVKRDYRFHIPDMIIPILRTNGLANSISIEIELTDKRLNRYIDTLEKYKDNNRFGHLIWLTQSESINKNLREAFRRVGGLGHTKMYIYEFEVPSPSSVYKIKK